jgi:hypothetical protein
MKDDPEPPLFHIFCDESRQTGSRYMVIGGMLVSSTDLPFYLEKIRKFRIDENWTHRFKWEKVPTKASLLSKYFRFLDFVFDKPHCLSFKCLFVDTTTFERGKDTEEVRFYKLYYNLLVHSFGKVIQPNNRCVVTFHRRTTTYKLGDLLHILNNGLRKKYSCSNNLVKAVESSDLRGSEMLQLADVLIGAIGYEINEYHLARGASLGKIKLMEYIKYRTGLQTFFESTPHYKKHFSIWNFKFNSRKNENAPSSTPVRIRTTSREVSDQK